MSASAGYDPICGMWLEEDKIAVTYAYLGQTYTFCCGECRDLFVRAPEAHIARFAHEPRNSAGYRCPFQRPENGSPATGVEHEAPRQE